MRKTLPLERRLRARRLANELDRPRPTATGERLKSAAIVRDGKDYSGHKSHAQVRAALGDEDPYTSNPGDIEGFMTTENRFVTRRQAVKVGVAAGQLTEQWLMVGRELLSSDINW